MRRRLRTIVGSVSQRRNRKQCSARVLDILYDARGTVSGIVIPRRRINLVSEQQQHNDILQGLTKFQDVTSLQTHVPPRALLQSLVNNLFSTADEYINVIVFPDKHCELRNSFYFGYRTNLVL